MLNLEYAINRTNGYAGRLIVISLTVDADAFVNDINVVTGCNGGYRAFRFTSRTIGAFFSNSMCHDRMVFGLDADEKHNSMHFDIVPQRQVLTLLPVRMH